MKLLRERKENDYLEQKLYITEHSNQERIKQLQESILKVMLYVMLAPS